MVSTAPLDWIEEIKQEIFAIEQAPILPAATPFATEILAQQLQARLGLKATIKLGTLKGLSADEVKNHTATARLFAFALAPYTSALYVTLGDEALNNLSSWLLASDLQAAISLPGGLQESFRTFLGAAAVDAIQATGLVYGSSLRLLSVSATMPGPAAMTALPVMVEHESVSISFLVLIPRALQNEIKQSEKKDQAELINQAVVSSKVNLAIRLLLELVPLSYSDIAYLQEGSLLLLERAIVAPEMHVQVVVGRRAFFSGKVQNNKLTITALAEPIEEIKPMDKTQESSPKQPGQEKRGSPQPPVIKASALGAVKPAVPTPPEEAPQDDPAFFLGEDEEFFVEDEELKNVLKEQEKKLPAGASSPTATSKAALAEIQHEESPTKIADVPLQVEVVVGYLRMSVTDLLNMHVGGNYTLGSPISAEVDLLVNGKRIAKGELLKSGDLLGVRIVSL